MNREEIIKVIQDYTEFFNKAKEQGRTVTVFDYVDSLEMNKEKAIDRIKEIIKGISLYPKQVQALQFAIDYMKDEGEIIGWVNYYERGEVGERTYKTSEDAERNKETSYRGDSIQIPIRKPKS